MERSTIRRQLHKTVREWINSITDVKVKEACEADVLVAGGCISSILLKEKVNDYDVYFRTKETASLVVAYYVNLFKSTFPTATHITGKPIEIFTDGPNIIIKSAGVASATSSDTPYQYFETAPEDNAAEYLDVAVNAKIPKDLPPYTPIFLSGNAVTLTNSIQLVTRFYGDIDYVKTTFDFEHTKCIYDFAANRLHLPENSLYAILTRSLIYTGSAYPICSMIRTNKFIQRGWSINAGNYLKIAFDINSLNLNSLNTLRDQLIGVDVAYFQELLEVLKKDITQTPGKVISATYIAELLDRLFA